MIKVSPLTQKKIRHFKEIKRGYWSFVILSIMLILSLFAELLINSKALVVKYDGSYYFPVVSDVRLGSEFGQESSSEADYRVLQKAFEAEGGDNFVILPLVPWNPYEQDDWRRRFPA